MTVIYHSSGTARPSAAMAEATTPQLPRQASASAPPVTSSSSTKPLINLLRGWPAPSLLPVEQLKAATADVLSDSSVVVDSLQYGPDSGFQPLRDQLARYLSSTFADFGAPNDPERICITGGASQNAACILQSFTDPDYTACVWVSAPCYFLMCPIFEDSGFAGRLRAVPEDDEGTDVEALERGFREHLSSLPSTVTYKTNLAPYRKAYRHIVYLVPASSNPSGRTTSLKRRQQLVRLARKYDALLIADDVYDFLQWDVPRKGSSASNGRDGGLAGKQASVSLPRPLPRLIDVDRMLPRDKDEESVNAESIRFGHAISNGSFSKMVAPGMRTGWVEATSDFAFGLAQTGSTKSGGAPSQFGSATIASLMRTGELDRHLSQVVRPALQWRHHLMARAVETHLHEYVEILCGGAESASSPAETYGGYFLWLKLRRSDISAGALAKRALVTENLVIAEGPLFKVKGDEQGPQFDEHIRLCFAWEDEPSLVEGVKRLANVFQDWDKPQPDAPQGGMSESEMGAFK